MDAGTPLSGVHVLNVKDLMQNITQLITILEHPKLNYPNSH